MGTIQDQQDAESILAKLDAEESGAAAPPQTDDPDANRALEILDGGDAASGQAPGETGADTTTEEVEAAKSKDDQSPIEPPVSWKAEWKEKFQALPRELQQVVADRESERESKLTKSQQESAEARKAAEAETAKVQAERQAYVNGLNSLITELETTDPIIAQGRKTDWVAELRSGDPTAAARHLEYEQREGMLVQRTNQRNFLVEQQRVDNFRKGHEELSKRLDFWSDEGKRTAFQQEFAKLLTEQGGFTPAEASNIDDWRVMVLGHNLVANSKKAALYDELMAKQTQIRPVKPVAPKTMRVQAPDDGKDQKDARAEALKRTARHTGSTTDAVNAILASL